MTLSLGVSFGLCFPQLRVSQIGFLGVALFWRKTFELTANQAHKSKEGKRTARALGRSPVSARAAFVFYFLKTESHVESHFYKRNFLF